MKLVWIKEIPFKYPCSVICIQNRYTNVEIINKTNFPVSSV